MSEFMRKAVGRVAAANLNLLTQLLIRWLRVQDGRERIHVPHNALGEGEVLRSEGKHLDYAAASGVCY